ncbi:MAG: transglutaminase-like domain-containing protein [Oscillospiraceae bacterium]
MTAEEQAAYLDSRLASVEMPAVGDNPILKTEDISVECTNSDDGYLTVLCPEIEDHKFKLQIQKEDKIYYYDLKQSEDPLVFPLQMGSGKYQIKILSHVENDRYAIVSGAEIDVSLTDEFKPFIFPNEYVNYTRRSEAVKKALLLSKDAQNDFDTVNAIFDFIVKNISYDADKAQKVTDGVLGGYLPDIDETLSTQKGICFDYASLFSSMLRSNGIPAKLVTGYAEPGHVYHAWTMIYITDIGWIGKEIRFDGKSWTLVDATFAASESDSGIKYFPVNEY